MDPFFYLVILAGILAGASTSLLGVYIVGMKMPFIGTCISHAAITGIVFATLAGLTYTTAAGVVFSVLAAISLSAVKADKPCIDANLGLAIMLSLMLGLAFMGMGLMQDSRTELLGLLWGSILFVRQETIITVAIMATALVLFLVLFGKEMKTLLFSRSIAAATGVHENFVYCIFLALCGLILSVNLRIIGGLLIFCLITNPPAAAYQICSSYKSVVIVSVFFGVLSAVGGLFMSLQFNLPTGAAVVLTSTAIFILCAGYSRLTAR